MMTTQKGREYVENKSPKQMDEKSAELHLIPATKADQATICRLFDDMRTYSVRVSGEHAPVRATDEFLTDRPPGCEVSAKHIFLIMQGSEAIGLVDLIADYPAPGTAYVGLFALAETYQGEGVGKTAFSLVEAYARYSLGAGTLRLGVLDTNPVLGFWQRVGFQDAGGYVPGATLLEKITLVNLSSSTQVSAAPPAQSRSFVRFRCLLVAQLEGFAPGAARRQRNLS